MVAQKYPTFYQPVSKWQ